MSLRAARGKWLTPPSQNGMVAGSLVSWSNEHYFIVHPAQSRQLRVAFTSRWAHQGTLTSPLLVRAARMKAGRESGQRRRTSLMPFCNGEDMVKARQGKSLESEANR